jgi:hypothetical protein
MDATISGWFRLVSYNFFFFSWGRGGGCSTSFRRCWKRSGEEMRGRDDDFLHDSCGSITTESDVNSDETPRPTRVFQYTFDNPSIFFLFLSGTPLPSLRFHTTDFLSSCAYRLEFQVTLYISFHKSETCTSAREEEEKRIFFRVDSIDGGSAAAVSFSRAM